jgi:hypothetical protein
MTPARGLLAALLSLLAAACASAPLPPPVVDPAALTVDGVRMDPSGEIAPALLAEALASYAGHFGTVRRETLVFDFPEKRVEAELAPIRRDVMAVVDFSLPATQPRLFVLDLGDGSVSAFRVAHGRNSDAAGDIALSGRLAATGGAVRASNLLDSNESAVGAYVAANIYDDGRWPGSLRLHGLDATNSCVFWRAIVMHEAAYMTPDPATGAVGTSDGCLSVEMAARPVVTGLLAEGGFLYAGPRALHVPSAADGKRDQSACEAVRLKPELGPQGAPPGA